MFYEVLNRKNYSSIKTSLKAVGLLCGMTMADQTFALPIATLSDLQTVVVHEQTFARTPVPFAPNSSALSVRLADPLSDANRDFSFFSGENYDVFYSNADGTPNPLGAFLTIEAVWPGPSGSMNINEVELQFGGAAPHSDFADFVSSFVYGSSPNVGSEALAVDGDLGTFSRFGVTSSLRMRLTVGFNGISDVATPSVPDGGSSAILLAFSIAGIATLSAARRARESL
jgi:hypothetical protein